MNKTFTAPLLLAGTLFCTAAFAADSTAVADTKYEVGIGIQYDAEGDNSDNLQSNGGLLLQGSYRFAPALSVTGNFAYSNGVNYSHYDKKTDIYRFIADVNYDFLPQKFFSPYIFAGLGYESFSDTPVDRDGFLAGFGGGVRFYFTKSMGLNVTAMAKYNLDHDDRAILADAAFIYRF